jgi:hypothetical protein
VINRRALVRGCTVVYIVQISETFIRDCNVIFRVLRILCLGLAKKNLASRASPPLILPKAGPEKFRFTLDLRYLLFVTRTHVPYIASTTLVHRNIVNSNDLSLLSTLFSPKNHDSVHWQNDGAHWQIDGAHWQIDSAHWQIDSAHWQYDSAHWHSGKTTSQPSKELSED